MHFDPAHDGTVLAVSFLWDKSRRALLLSTSASVSGRSRLPTDWKKT